MYKIIDTQGSGTFASEIFKTKKDVIKRLADFHDTDFINEDEITGGYKNIYQELEQMKDDNERLDWLLEWGQWELEEATERATDGEWDEINKYLN